MVLTSSTIAFTVCFMVWMMFAVLGIPLKIVGSKWNRIWSIDWWFLCWQAHWYGYRLGLLTDKFGGRIVFFIWCWRLWFQIYCLSFCHRILALLVLGLFVGLAGGSFTVGIAYVAKWFWTTKSRLGNGHLRGNAGSALTKLIAPVYHRH